ncbi:MAG: sulfite exporter TauE/SafE family protein [Cyanobacteria bacterium J06638_20]
MMNRGWRVIRHTLLGCSALVGAWAVLPAWALAHPNHAEPDLLRLLEPEAMTPSLMLASLGLAVGLGAAHALSPGHGKTMAAAYLVGNRGTPWNALVLGVTTTVTHTLMVFVLGAIALLLAQVGWTDHVYPILSLLSGVMVLGIGAKLLYERWGAVSAEPDPNQAHHHPHDHGHHHHPHDHGHHHHPHDHGHHHHPHDHGHHHHHGHSHDHTHGEHSHSLPASNILALGIAGGIVPCPSALVLLLSAIALHQTAYGLALVTAFSLGLTLVLVGIGLSVIYSRQWFDQLPLNPRIFRYLPVASAIIIMAVGAMLTAQAIA